jgi:hypothetical protein
MAVGLGFKIKAVSVVNLMKLHPADPKILNGSVVLALNMP